MEGSMRKSSGSGSRRTEAYQKLATVIRLCTDWLWTCGTLQISTLTYSRGCLRSVILERRYVQNGAMRKSHELQLMLVLPDDTGNCQAEWPRHWQLLVYSRMAEKQTRMLKQQILSTTTFGPGELKMFCVTTRCLVRL